MTSLDVTGFTLDWTTNDAVATEICYLALAGPRRGMIVGSTGSVRVRRAAPVGSGTQLEHVHARLRRLDRLGARVHVAVELPPRQRASSSLRLDTSKCR